MLGKKGSESTGEGEETTLFWIIEIMVCFIILVGFTVMATRIIADTDEDLIAKDLGLTIMAASAAPGNLFYRYSPNTEGYNIQITESEVIVKAGSSASFKYVPMDWLTIVPKTIGKTLSVPIIKIGNKITFEEPSAKETQILCSQLKSSYKDKPTLNILTRAYDDEEEKYLKILKQVLELLLKDEYDTVQTLDPDIQLTIGFTYNNNVKENKFTSKFKEKDLQFQNNQKISCNIYKLFKEKFADNFYGFEDIPSQQEEGITIMLGNSDRLATMDFERIMNDYAVAIKDALVEAKKK